MKLRFCFFCRNGNYGKLVGLISKGLTSVHQEKMKNLNAGMLLFTSQNRLQKNLKGKYPTRKLLRSLLRDSYSRGVDPGSLKMFWFLSTGPINTDGFSDFAPGGGCRKFRGLSDKGRGAAEQAAATVWGHSC